MVRIPPQDSRIFSGQSLETSPVPLEISLSLSTGVNIHVHTGVNIHVHTGVNIHVHTHTRMCMIGDYVA